MSRSSAGNKLAAPLLIVLALVLAFAAGFLSAHFRSFPFSIVEGLVAASDGGVAGRDPEPAEDRRSGLWHLTREAVAKGEAPDREVVDELADLPYLSGYEAAPSTGGVTVFDASAAYEGLNLVVSGHAPEAYLMNMAGEVLHRWRRELADVWPRMAAMQDLRGFETFWRRAHLLPSGDLLAIYDGIGLVKLDRDSNVVWAHPGGEHHDLFVDESGAIHVLTRKPRQRHERLDLDAAIEEDYVTVLDGTGRVLREFSILDSLLESDYAALLAKARRRGDILHTNTIERLDGRFAERHPLYSEGNLLVSFPRLDSIAVIDPRSERVVWTLGGLWRFQHQPTLLDNGNILVFDNTGHRGDSKVVEVEPLTHEIVWAYRGSPERRFTSYFLGSSQRLANGNTLITESTAGRAFEVDSAGAIVWEFVNPERAGEDGGLIASLLEVVRLGWKDLDEEFAARLGGGGGVSS